MKFVVGPNHRCAGRTSVNAGSLQNEIWAVFEEGDELRMFTEASFASARLGPGTKFVMNDDSVIPGVITTNRFEDLMPSRGVKRSRKRFDCKY